MDKQKLFHLVERVVLGPDIPECQSNHYIKEHWLGHQVITGEMSAEQAYDQLDRDNGTEPPTAA